MQGIKDLTHGPIKKMLFNLAMPIMATSFIQMAYSLTDMAWLGRLGSEAVAAVGAVGILMWMSGSISLISKVGSEVSVGQSIGSQNYENARKFASHNLTIALLISLFLGAFLFFFARSVTSLFGLEPHITDEATGYLKTVSTALPFPFLSAAFTGIYNAAGRSKTPFYISALGLGLNMVLDPLFILVLKQGVQGAAIATWISQFTVVALFIYQIRFRNIILGGFPFVIRLKAVFSKRIFKLGLPVALFNTLFSFVNMFLCRIAVIHGGHIGLMSQTTGGQIEALAWNTSQGFSTALSTFTAQNFAARKSYRVIQAFKATLWMTGIFGTMCTLLFIFFGANIFSLLVPEREAYLAGGTYLRIMGYSQLFMMLEITTQGLFYGTGKTLPPAVISISGNLLRIPLAIFLTNLGWGVNGIWWAISLSSILKGIAAFTWFIMIKRRTLALAEQ